MIDIKFILIINVLTLIFIFQLGVFIRLYQKKPDVCLKNKLLYTFSIGILLFFLPLCILITSFNEKNIKKINKKLNETVQGDEIKLGSITILFYSFRATYLYFPIFIDFIISQTTALDRTKIKSTKKISNAFGLYFRRKDSLQTLSI